MLKQLFDFLYCLKFDIEQEIKSPCILEIKTGPFGMMIIDVEFMHRSRVINCSAVIEKYDFDLEKHERDYIVSLQKVLLHKVRKEIK